MSVKSSVSEKAVRLLASASVQPVGAAAAFRVKGDHGTYDVVIADGFSFCSCPAHGGCSHIGAATILQDALVDGPVAAFNRHDARVAA